LPRLRDSAERCLERHSRAILVASVTYLAVIIIAIALGASWIRDDRIASVRVLGSGSRLSVLVVSENTRLLIAGGDDASAFGNALAGALHPTSRRIDVVLLWGNEADRAVVAKARRDFPNATTFLLDGPLRSELSNFDLRPHQVIENPTHVALPGGVDIYVSPSSAEASDWSIEIQRGHSFVVVASDPEVFNSREGRPSAVVLTRKFDAEELTFPLPGALVQPSQSITFADIVEKTGRSGTPAWIVQVNDSESARLSFTERGLELPNDAVRVEPEPT